MDRFGHRFLIACAVIPGNQNVTAHRNTHKQVDEQVDQRTGGADSRQCRRTGKPTHHDDVGSVIQQLQHTGQHQRHRKPDDLTQQRAFGHV